MRTTVVLDDDLLAEAQRLTGVKEKTALVREGLTAEILRLLGALPQARVATDGELLAFIGRHEPHGLGIGYVGAQLLASTMLSDATLWTRDRRLRAAAARLGVAHAPTS